MKTAARVVEYPFLLKRASQYLQALANGTHEFWAAMRPTELIQFVAPSTVPDGVWIMPPDLIEPPEATKRIKALPVKRKSSLITKRRIGKGRMAAVVAPVAAPPGLFPDYGHIGLPVADDNGDLGGIDE